MKSSASRTDAAEGEAPGSAWGRYVTRQRLAAPDMLNCPINSIALYVRRGMPFFKPLGSQKVWFDPALCREWFEAQLVVKTKTGSKKFTPSKRG